MSTRTRKKRKASEAAGTNGLPDESAEAFKSYSVAALQDPSSFASAMLGCLPQDASLATADSKKLLKTFDVVKAELQHRTNLMAENSVKTGANSYVVLSGTVAMPPDVFGNILSFVSTHEMVHQSSFVAKAWLATARSPQLWHTLNNDSGLLEKSRTITNMTKILNLLKRPQFASLKVLSPSDKVQTRKKAFEQIAKACPLLEVLDVGYSLYSSMKVDDAALQELPSLFPHLKEIRLSMDRLTNAGLTGFFERMGDRLESICIRDGYPSDREKLTDLALTSTIARFCPNLEHFVHYGSYPQGVISETGLIDLLKDCRKLKSILLTRCDQVGLPFFEHIIDNDINLERLFVAGNLELMSKKSLCTALSEKLESFEAMSINEHWKLCFRARQNRQISTLW